MSDTPQKSDTSTALPSCRNEMTCRTKDSFPFTIILRDHTDIISDAQSGVLYDNGQYLLAHYWEGENLILAVWTDQAMYVPSLQMFFSTIKQLNGGNGKSEPIFKRYVNEEEVPYDSQLVEQLAKANKFIDSLKTKYEPP